MALIKQNDAFKKSSSIRKVPVNNSAFIQHFQYDPDNQQLVVVLKSGGEYIYNNVDAAMVDQFIQAPSKGQFYAKYIKGKFESTRLIDKSVGPEEGKHGNARVENRNNRGTRDKNAGTSRSGKPVGRSHGH